MYRLLIFYGFFCYNAITKRKCYDPFNAGQIIVKLNNNQLTVEIPTFDEIGLVYSNTLIPNTPNHDLLLILGVLCPDHGCLLTNRSHNRNGV